MASLRTRNPRGELAGWSRRLLETAASPIAASPTAPPPQDHPFNRHLVPCQTTQWETGAGAQKTTLYLQHQPQCIGRFFFPWESPSKWVRAARMDTWEHELSRQLPVAGEPDLRLQEGAISSAHSPSDNNPGTAPSSAAPDMVRMLNEWAQETERKE